jgi:hypothetical protein
MPETKRRPTGAAPTSAKPPPPSKRRIVSIANDADLVLAQCRKLRDALRRKQARREASDDDDDDDDDGGGARRPREDDDEDDDEWDFEDETKKNGGKGRGKKEGKDGKTKSSGVAVKTDHDAGGGGDDAKNNRAKTQQLSLTELKRLSNPGGDGKESIVEVVEMNSTEVMEGIENVAVTIATQVLARRGFSLDIPCEFKTFFIHS